MRTGVSLTVSAADRDRLEAMVADRNAPQKLVWRCRIVLGTADGLGISAIMREAGVAKTAVWRWQERFMAEGVDGLLHDKTRSSRIPPLGAEVAERVVRLTLDDRRSKLLDEAGWIGERLAGTPELTLGEVRSDLAGRGYPATIKMSV